MILPKLSGNDKAYKIWTLNPLSDDLCPKVVKNIFKAPMAGSVPVQREEKTW